MSRVIKPDVQIQFQPIKYIKRTPENEHHFKGVPKKYKVKTIENGEVNFYKSGLEV